MHKRLTALFAALTMLLCGCGTTAVPETTAVSETITGFTDCAGWTSADWERADDQTQQDAALAFMVEYIGSTDETFRKLQEREGHDDLTDETETMQQVISRWFSDAQNSDTLSDLLLLMQEADADKEQEHD